MKRLFSILIALVLVSSVGLARYIAYPVEKPPALSLPDAYAIAVASFGPEKNKFHCTGAGCLISLSPDGEWAFSFHDTKGTHKTVVVFFDKTIRVVDGDMSF
jgi:hypothetical protein